MIRFEVKDTDSWVLCIEAADMDDWATFRDAAGGKDHVRAVDADGTVLREFIPAEEVTT